MAVSFTEEMKGFVAFGEEDFDSGFRAGRESRTALMFHLTITAEDIDSFIADREHEAWPRAGSLRGARRPAARSSAGSSTCSSTRSGDRSASGCSIGSTSRDGSGQPLTLAGYKVVEDDPGFDLWRDTTTLFTRVLRGHVEEPGPARRRKPWPRESSTSTGLDFARQLTTFRCDPPTRLDALARFGALFAGDLWDVYGPRGKERGA